MIALVRSEWFKLRTIRLNIWLPLVSIGGLVLVTSLVALLTSDPEALTGEDIVLTIGGFSILVSMMIAVTTSLGITSEFNHNTIRPTLAATPRRTQVFGAKAIVSLLFGALIGSAGMLLAYAVGASILSARGGSPGVSIDAGTLTALIGVVLLAVLLAGFGFGLGLLVRNGPTAVSLVILWPLLIEGILAAVLTVGGVENAQRFLPYTSAFALASPQDSDPGRVYGGVFFAIVVVLLITAGAFVNQRRDV